MIAARRVIIASPYSGDRDKNDRYLNACIADCAKRGESPYASHAILTRGLDDTDPKQREQGMTLAYAWYRCAHALVVYEDLGLSGGMKTDIAEAKLLGLRVEYRRLNGEWAA